jgi:hypothetical protein
LIVNIRGIIAFPAKHHILLLVHYYFNRALANKGLIILASLVIPVPRKVRMIRVPELDTEFTIALSPWGLRVRRIGFEILPRA